MKDESVVFAAVACRNLSVDAMSIIAFQQSVNKKSRRMHRILTIFHFSMADELLLREFQSWYDYVRVILIHNQKEGQIQHQVAKFL